MRRELRQVGKSLCDDLFANALVGSDEHGLVLLIFFTFGVDSVDKHAYSIYVSYAVVKHNKYMVTYYHLPTY